jgi:hypothetical protein
MVASLVQQYHLVDGLTIDLPSELLRRRLSHGAPQVGPEGVRRSVLVHRWPFAGF